MNIEICPICKEEFIKKTSTQETCPKKECKKKNHDISALKRQKDGELVRNKEAAKKSAAEFRQSDAAKQSIIADMVLEVGYAYCQKCGPDGGKFHDLEGHHITYRSELRNHPKRHCKKNILVLCNTCHLWFHEEKHRRDPIIVERKLWEVFPEVFRQEFYVKSIGLKGTNTYTAAYPII